MLIQGPTCLWIDSNRNIHYKSYEKVEIGGETGIIVAGRFVPDDGPSSYFRVWNVEFTIAFEDIRSLLNPATLEVPADELAEATEGDGDLHVHVFGGDSTPLRATLAFPFWFFATIFQGDTCVHIDDSGNLRFKKMKSVKRPRRGNVVDDEFKSADGRGAAFNRWSTDIGLSLQGMEGMWNPATSEILRAKEAVETATDGGTTIGAGEDEKSGVVARVTTAVSSGRLADYAPFSMMDGSFNRQQMNTVYESRSEFEDKSTFIYIGGLVVAFFIGAMSPRLNGSTGGGGGSGGISAPVPMPSLTVDPATVQAGLDALVGVM
ncbi:hypothetical protein [Halomarina oriensis]|uniref:Uncharacterized protein n=1 Tax=Halomarina oriensis TaxID=671145 RepID=A0A6B0GLY4_9EURY|nr:hypothetical protein [Halomarina oriensis]MWG33145.1 hypothetical protein [Halomarina oriensis]